MGLPFSCVLLRIMYIMLNRMHNWAGIWTWNAVLGVLSNCRPMASQAWVIGKFSNIRKAVYSHPLYLF